MNRPRGMEPMHLVFAALGGAVLLFIIAPLAGMVLSTGRSELSRTAADPAVTASVRLTLLTSMGATLILAVASVPFAWLLARRNFPLKALVNGIVDVPIVIPHSAAGIALLGVIAPGTLVGGTAERLGIEFVGGPAGIMAGMAFVSVPFLVNAARDGFAAVPLRLEQTALALGASPLRVFFTISLPLAWRSVLSGLILMWARGMSEFGAVLIIAYHPMITPVLIYERFGAFGLRYARPVSVIFIGVCLALFVVLRLVAGGRRHAGG
ncbi:MAG: ABC transporter permease [Candidatus Krumholzibacteria bacterium]|nr:ABC transporter permease [Candidatus Krumholzibacteria bacterium]